MHLILFWIYIYIYISFSNIEQYFQISIFYFLILQNMRMKKKLFKFSIDF